ncbi:MAG: S8 family serine peptidase [Deltaproteobacteria bacterium]|nr:S8 family serine peptidase [Deltaproteobacteria bacterium]
MKTVLILLMMLAPVNTWGRSPGNNATARLAPMLRTMAMLSNMKSMAPKMALNVILTRQNWYLGPDNLMPVYIDSSDPAGLVEKLRAGGAVVSRPVAGVVPARIPVSLLFELSTRPDIKWVEQAPYHTILLDKSLPDIRGDKAHRGDGLSTAYDGKGVILGIVDTGIQWNHPDFLDQSGHTRCLYLWNQQADKEDRHPPKGFFMGNECTRQDMESRKCQSADWMGHGTHCCGIMGSSGEPYTGVAPGGEFIMVAVMDFSFLVDGVRYIFDKAESLGRPAVVNLSLGGHDGPHDGTALESKALSSLTGPGKIIIAAAGNEGSSFIHLSYELTDEPKRTRVVVTENSMPIGSRESAAVINIWAEKPDAQFAVEMLSKDGDVIQATPWLSATGSNITGDFKQDSVVLGGYILETAGGASPENGKYAMRITIAPSSDPNTYEGSGYKYYLLGKGRGGFHAWCLEAAGYRTASHFQDQNEPGTTAGDNRFSVGMPATGKEIIAVAAYNTKNKWTDVDGNDHTGDWQVGTIADFSSRGPSLDESLNGIKPEVAAPGQIIASAASAVGSTLFGKELLVDDEHLLMQGTSMACPHVSGAVALLLQANPSLDPEGIEHILSLSSRRDEFTGNDLPNPDFGYGKLDVQAALKIVEQEKCEQEEGRIYTKKGECLTLDEICARQGPGWVVQDGMCVNHVETGGCSSLGKSAHLSLGLLLVFAFFTARFRRRGA